MSDRASLDGASMRSPLFFPPTEQDPFTSRMAAEFGYHGARRLPDGTYAGIIKLVFTWAICLECHDTGHERRYCYEDLSVCLGAFSELRSGDSEPEGWIARR